MLPNISVKVNVPPRKSLSRMAKIAKSVRGLDVRENFDQDFPNLSISFPVSSKDNLENLIVVFTINEKIQDRVWVELSSKSWAEFGPTYEEYVSLTKRYLKSLLSSYNRKYKTNRRFRIPSKNALEPRLSDILSRIFSDFVNTANRSLLHQYSWYKFYGFIQACHSNNSRFSSDDLRRLLFKAGFSDYYIEKLSSIYYHGRAILSNECWPPKKIIG